MGKNKTWEYIKHSRPINKSAASGLSYKNQPNSYEKQLSDKDFAIKKLKDAFGIVVKREMGKIEINKQEQVRQKEYNNIYKTMNDLIVKKPAYLNKLLEILVDNCEYIFKKINEIPQDFYYFLKGLIFC